MHIGQANAFTGTV